MPCEIDHVSGIVMSVMNAGMAVSRRAKSIFANCEDHVEPDEDQRRRGGLLRHDADQRRGEDRTAGTAGRRRPSAAPSARPPPRPRRTRRSSSRCWRRAARRSTRRASRRSGSAAGRGSGPSRPPARASSAMAVAVPSVSKKSTIMSASSSGTNDHRSAPSTSAWNAASKLGAANAVGSVRHAR